MWADGRNDRGQRFRSRSSTMLHRRSSRLVTGYVSMDVYNNYQRKNGSSRSWQATTGWLADATGRRIVWTRSSRSFAKRTNTSRWLRVLSFMVYTIYVRAKCSRSTVLGDVLVRRHVREGTGDVASVTWGGSRKGSDGD